MNNQTSWLGDVNNDSHIPTVFNLLQKCLKDVEACTEKEDFCADPIELSNAVLMTI